jgi:guanosine-3',5'-bis(diphosphate) 3'-pyrophosphohydrolase
MKVLVNVYKIISVKIDKLIVLTFTLLHDYNYIQHRNQMSHPESSCCEGRLDTEELPCLVPNNMTLMLRAVSYAAWAHRDQRRKDKSSTPYINHPIGVAELIASVGLISDIDILRAAVLHDVVEDTPCTISDIRNHFGGFVGNIVEEVTDNKSLSKDERKRLQIEHAHDMSYPARVVKLADKLHNLTDLIMNPPPHWSEFRIQGYFVWAHKVIEGLRGTNVHLEKALDSVFSGQCFRQDGSSFNVLPPESERNTMLESYLQEMKNTNN